MLKLRQPCEGYALGMCLGARMLGRAGKAMFRRVCIAPSAAAIISLPAPDAVLR
ncbi:MAG TPA: hypothetical protein VJ790_20820 [Dongiaceae bacterium]|nr:hypothetical protein [Dongiaceae bacterium]